MQKQRNKNDRRHGVSQNSNKGISPAIQSANEYLCVRGPIFGPSGYTRMTRNVITGLHLAEKRFWIDAIPWAVQPSIELEPAFKEIVRTNSAFDERTMKTGALLCICLPQDLPGRPIAPNTWNQTIFETTAIPDRWVEVLKSVPSNLTGNPAIRGLILPCRGNVESFREAPQIKKIVPIAIDYDLYSPDGPQADLPRKSSFNILANYHGIERKNPDFLLRLINELPGDATVYVKTFGIGMSSYERFRIARGLKDKITNDKISVVLLYDLVSDVDQAAIYRAVDLVINTSHGEGWDLPRCEAYACGVPAIGPLFIGPADYTIEEFRLIGHELIPCPDSPPFFSSKMRWADLDLIDYLGAIEQIRSDRVKYRELALKQRDHLIRHTGSLQDYGEKIWNILIKR